MTSRRALFLALALLVAGGCKREAPPLVPLLPSAPSWTIIPGDGWSIALPGPAVPVPRNTATLEGGTSTLYEVHLAGGIYSFAHFSSPALASGSQNRKALVEATDTELFRRLDATIASEQDLKVEAGRPGLTWPARDLVLKTSGGTTCAARDLFAREHYFVLTACRTPDAGGNDEVWSHMRDSLSLTIDPMEGVGGVDASSWATWSPDGKATLRQRSATGGHCLLVCDRNNAEVWHAEAECRGSSRDAHFVSDDCERSVLFYGDPPRGASLLASKVLSVYAREQLKYDVIGAAVVKKTDTVSRVSHLVQGLGGNSGSKPRYGGDGKSVVFVTVEDRTQTVPLTATADAEPGLDLRAPPPKAPAKKRPRGK